MATPATRFAGLARATRAAIVVPALMALALRVIGQPTMAGTAVFGTFAHLVLVSYAADGATRSAQAALLTATGAVAIALGVLASPYPVASVAAAAAAGFLAERAAVDGGRIAPIRTAVLLVFMLSVAMPAPAVSALSALAGWLLAGLVAQPALRLLWIDLPAAVSSTPRPRIGQAAATALAMGLAVILVRLVQPQHAFWIVLGVLPVVGAAGSAVEGTFWREQGGTLLGFVAGTCLVALIGAHLAWYWLALPIAIFAATYAANAIGFLAGQAGFTVFAIILFCILTPGNDHVARARVEDIALGGALSVALATLRRAKVFCFISARKKALLF